MNKTLTSETNGHQPELQTLEEQILTCGGEMNTEGKLRTAPGQLSWISWKTGPHASWRTRGISPPSSGCWQSWTPGSPQETNKRKLRTRRIPTTKRLKGLKPPTMLKGLEAADDAEAAGAKHGDEEAKHEPHGPNASSASILSMPIERLKEIAGDPKAAAVIFLQARGGEPLDCPGCGHRTYTKRVTGQGNQRPDIFRCTPCKSEFGIKTGTADARLQGAPGNVARRHQASGRQRRRGQRAVTCPT